MYAFNSVLGRKGFVDYLCFQLERLWQVAKIFRASMNSTKSLNKLHYKQH